MLSPVESCIEARCEAGTNSPLIAVATRILVNSKEIKSASSVRACVEHSSPLTFIWIFSPAELQVRVRDNQGPLRRKAVVLPLVYHRLYDALPSAWKGKSAPAANSEKIQGLRY